MKFLLTNGQMRAADRREMLFTSSIVLMERAGKAIAERVAALDKKEKIVCVCGGGNNGGDGFVCARYLLERGFDVCVVCQAEKLSEETKANKEKFVNLGGEVVEKIPKGEISVLVDCLLGTGFVGDVRETTAIIIKEINAKKNLGAYVISADIPSGLCGDNGVGEVCVYADETVCIAAEKVGVRLSDGLDFSGKITVADVGIPVKENHFGEYVRLLEKSDVADLLPPRKRNSHKGSYGKTAIVAGSEKYTGAALLSVKAALKSGVGYVTLFTPSKIKEKYFLTAPEALVCGLNGGGSIEFNEKEFENLCNYDSIAFGMGTTVEKQIYKGIIYLLEHYEGRLILDADALNSIAKFGHIGDFLRKKKCDVLITPHVKEFSRLIGKTPREILNDPIEITRRIARVYGVSVLLKNASTLITDERFCFVNTTGCSAQAKGGSGDVLSGVIAGLCAQGLSPFDGGRVASFLVGRAAEIAAAELSEYSATPTDFIDRLGKAFLSVTKNPKQDGQR